MNSKLMRGTILASSCFVMAGQAWAQDVPAPADVQPETAVGGAQSEEPEDENVVTVTANRREENIQDVPIAVTAVSADNAALLGVGQTDQLVQLVPSLALNRSSQGLVPFIRGVGTNSSTIGNEPSVAMYIDDVYIPSGSGSVFNFNNIDAIEVLRGPQGTLFGRNATGGVVHIRTRRPSFTPDLRATATYANYDTISGQLYASTGLSDNIAASIAAYGMDQGEGWGRNILNGREVYFAESYGIRGRILFQFDADTELMLNGSYDWRRSDQGQASRAVPGSFTRAGYSPDAAGAGFYDATTDFNQFYESELYQFSARFSHDFGNARLVSITAYTEITADPSVLDIDASPSPFFNAETGQGQEMITQEFQLLSADDSPFTWILGAFFLSDEAYFRARFTGQIFGGGTGLSDTVQETFSISAFAQGTYEILPRTNLTLGVRYTSDHRELNGVARLISAAGTTTTFGPFSDEVTFSSVTGRLALDHHLTDDIMVYAAYNRGFKSGVYNIAGIAVGSTAVAAQPVLPEDLNAYSVGFRTEFLDGAVRFNGEAYYYDYRNIQVQNVIPGGTQLVNGGQATIYGVEFETQVRPVQNLLINWAVSFNEGQYDEFLNGPQFFPLPPNPQVRIPPGCNGVPPYPPAAGASPAAQRACDLSGNETIQTPPFTSNLSVIYTIPSSVGEFTLSGSWAVGGNYFFEADNNPVTRQPRTNVVNASVQWASVDERFTVRLWANNITEEEYYNYVTESTSSGNKYSPAAPRTYGVTLGVNF